MTRSSTPSKRPQTRTTPGPAASASTRACVSGAPRGESRRRGRSSVATASMARPSTSAFITMPGPPPAGVSSTVRCLSVAKVRISTTSSDQAPAARALPARLAPNGPGNMSGKMVRTLARHMVSASRPPPRGRGFFFGPRDHDPPAAMIDDRHVSPRRTAVIARLPSVIRPHLDQIAGAEIVDGDDGAER